MSLRIVLALLVLHGAVGFAFLRTAGPGFPLDDTWAHMVFARSFAEGQGFAYNPGQPETGVSAPLWTALLALPVGIADGLHRHPEVLEALPGIDAGTARAWDGRPDDGVRLLGGLIGLLLAIVGTRLAARAGRWPAAFTAAALTLDPLLVADRFSGMELALFGLLSLLFVEALLDELPRRAGLLAAGLALARPEGLVLALFGLYWLLRRRQGVVRYVSLMLLCLLPWVGYCLVVSGRPWPATFDTKAAMVLEPRAVFGALAALGGDTGWGWALPLAVGVGIFSLEGGRHSLGTITLGAALVLLGGVLFSRPLEVAGDPPRVPFYWARYVHIAWPLLLVLASTGVSSLVRTAYAGLRCRPHYAVALIGPCALVLFLMRGLPAYAAERSQRFAAECADVEALNVAAGRWIAEHTDRRAVVATHDAGAIRFFGQRETIDLFGNQCHELLAAERQGEAAARAWLLARHPDVLAVFPALWARGHSPELASLWAQLPAQEGAALVAAAQDYAELFGLTQRVATFSVTDPATVPSPLHAHLAIFVAP